MVADNSSDISIKKTPVDVRDLGFGMFVSELDIPWLDSPFMLQGFLIENEQQIIQLQAICKTVIIDKTLSVGAYHAHLLEPAKSTMEFRHSQQLINSTPQPLVKPAAPTNNFVEILRSIKKGNTPKVVRDAMESESSSIAGRSTNVDNIKDSSALSLSEHIQNDVSNILGGAIHRIKSFLTLPKKSIKTADDTSLLTSQATNITNSVPVEFEIAEIYPEFEKTQEATKQIFDAISRKENIDVIHVSASLDSMLKSIERSPDALIWLAKLKQTDDYSYSHALNVSINLMAFGHFLALPRQLVRDLGLVGLLQDVGKVDIPQSILKKTHQLTEEERTIVRTHVDSSIETLRTTSNINQQVLDIIKQHHERFDGSGYPLQLKGKQISIGGQMAGIIDTYCAMTTNKPYAKGMFSQKVLEEIYASKDKHFSSSLVDQLIQFFGIYPVSSLVELNSGEVGVVIQQNNVRRLLPRVMVLLGPDKVKNDYPITLDLILSPKTPDGTPYSIRQGLPPDSYGLNPADFYV